MKGLKVFSWSCLALALVSLLISFFADTYWNAFLIWRLSALVFALAFILSLLVIRALKEIKEQTDLKILMKA